MNETSPFDEPVRQLYAAFKSRTLKTQMSGCECCASHSELKHLSFTPLSELDAGELDRYVWHAIGTVGTENDFRHFVPRILELMAGENPFQEEVVAEKLSLAHWTEWTLAEQSAIKRFFDVYWDTTLEKPNWQRTANDAVCVLGGVFEKLQPFLDRWIRCEHVIGLNQLAEFAANEAVNASSGFINQPFWHNRQEQMKQVASWLISAETMKTLEDRWLANPQGSTADALLKTIELITPFVVGLKK